MPKSNITAKVRAELDGKFCSQEDTIAAINFLGELELQSFSVTIVDAEGNELGWLGITEAIRLPWSKLSWCSVEEQEQKERSRRERDDPDPDDYIDRRMAIDYPE